MVLRLGLLVAASVAAYAVRQLNVKNSNSVASVDKLTGIHIFELRFTLLSSAFVSFILLDKLYMLSDILKLFLFVA